ncbi:hypothetical protein FRC11_006423 [Ceratobasidium sp. 423]|nr:hypothetical protein FRC11_006423 [Ceratobasidium sp. 423]
MPHSKDIPSPKKPAQDGQRFRELWKMQSRFQQGMLCVAAISVGGTWLASSSLDSNLVFMELMTGNVVGVIKFESRFHVTAMAWGSDSILYAGCSNGIVLVINYVLTDHRPIFMRSILQSFKAPVSTIALDNTGNQLAIGCGGEAFIFARPVFGSVESWDLVDHVSAPSDGHYSLITAMAYSGSTPEQRHLFIGHAKAGYCVWRSPRDYRRTPYIKGGLVCSIGSATMATDGSFIVIITLDHSTVVYPVDQDGPKLNEARVYPNHEPAGYRPIVPVTLAANRMVLKGSTSGQVPVMDLLNGPLAPIDNTSNDVVRVLTGYSDKIIVGLSDKSGSSSQIICYLDVAVSISDFIHADDDHPVFEITISELEEAGCFNTVDGQDGIVARLPGSNQSEPRSFLPEKGTSTAQDPRTSIPFVNILSPLARRISATMRHRRTWSTIVVVWGFITVLVVDPPNIPDVDAGKSTSFRWEDDDPLPAFSDSTDVGYVDPNRGGGLGVLLLFLGSYVATRLMWWGTWGITLTLMLLGFIFKATVYILLVFPRLIRFTMTNLPTFLYRSICDALEGYDIPVCPARA